MARNPIHPYSEASVFAFDNSGLQNLVRIEIDRIVDKINK